MRAARAQAVVSKPKARNLRVVSRTKSLIKTKAKGKIVKFPLARIKKKKLLELTQLQREDLILNTRCQAQKLARSILRKWRSRLDLEEVDSMVDLSLCEAAKRFDPNKGASFITFLYYHLRGNLIRLVSDAANQNTVPLFDREMSEGMPHQGQSSPIANALEVAAALSGQEQVLPDEEFYKKELVELSRNACSKLDTLEQQVIGRVFMDEEHLFDVAKNLGYSRCHISRVKRKALDTLQSELTPAVIGPSTEKLHKLSGRRKLVSRRGQQRREILKGASLGKGRRSSEFLIAV